MRYTCVTDALRMRCLPAREELGHDAAGAPNIYRRGAVLGQHDQLRCPVPSKRHQ
jgi:hypothetical protein